jgi:hypothetical protein
MFDCLRECVCVSAYSKVELCARSLLLSSPDARARVQSSSTTEMDAIYRVLIWSVFGFAIYFGYGIRNSKLNDIEDEPTEVEQSSAADPNTLLSIQALPHDHKE